MSLAPLVYAMGRGPGRARSLSEDEAADAMRAMLAGTAEPEAVGALLMLMRYRGETPAEIAGFVTAARESLDGWAAVAPGLDWPSYAAGRSRGLPWFLLSAKLLAQAGVPVLLHGWTANAGKLSDPRQSLESVDIPTVDTPATARAALGKHGIAYLPLENLSPDLLRLLRLREVLGLRSAVNTVLRCLNPCDATASVQGVFHPPYRALQQEASLRLGLGSLTVIKGGGGEFERNPAKPIEVFGVTQTDAWTLTAPAKLHTAQRLAEGVAECVDLAALWSGAAHDPFGIALVRGTAALALLAAGRAIDLEAAEAMAETLWLARLA